MNFLKKITKLYFPYQSDAFTQKLSNILTKKKYSEKEIIVKLKEIPSKFYILKKGIVRSYIVGSQGKEHIKILYTKNNIFAPMTALIRRKPSVYSFDCLTDCEILEGNYSDLLALTNSDLEFSILYSKILEEMYIRTGNKIHDLSILNATERFIKLKKEKPTIENQIKQYHIASYLNITPTQLSRIKRIKKEYYSK
jgi:CRP-like cAMP-binding protein